jgi:hypothetical protein
VQTVTHVNILNRDVFRQFQVNGGKVPNALDSRTRYRIGNNLCLLGRNRDYGDVYVFFLDKSRCPYMFPVIFISRQ